MRSQRSKVGLIADEPRRIAVLPVITAACALMQQIRLSVSNGGRQCRYLRANSYASYTYAGSPAPEIASNPR